MKRKMQLVYMKSTGHVLVAFTRNAGTGVATSVHDHVGDALIVRSKVDVVHPLVPPPEFLIPADLLDMAVVDFDAGVLHAPTQYAFAGSSVTAFSLALPVPKLTQTELEVTLTPAQDSELWAQIVQRISPPKVPPERRTMVHSILQANPTVKVPLTLVPNSTTTSGIPKPANFDTIVLASGFQPFIELLAVS